MATSEVDALRLDPWHEPGSPLEEQYRSWKQRIKAPYDKHQVDAYTRTRVILMNRTENGAWNFAHHFSRSTDDPVIKSLLARTRDGGAATADHHQLAEPGRPERAGDHHRL